jgi:hypothetical protein
LLGLLAIAPSGTAHDVQAQAEVAAEEMLFVHRAMATPAEIKLRYTGRLTSARAIGMAMLNCGAVLRSTTAQLKDSNGHFVVLI